MTLSSKCNAVFTFHLEECLLHEEQLSCRKHPGVHMLV